MRLAFAFALSVVLGLFSCGCETPEEAPVCPAIAISSGFQIHLVRYAGELGDGEVRFSVVGMDVPVSADATIGAWDDGAECRYDASLGATRVRCFPRTSGTLDVSVLLEGPFDDLVGEHELSIELTQGDRLRSVTASLVLEERYPYGEDCGPYHVAGSITVDVDALEPSPT